LLRERDAGRKHGRERAGDGHGGHRRRAQHHHERKTTQQVDACGHHRGRVDQRADWRWPCHRVRQPHVQRQLSALASTTEEQSETNQGRRADVAGRVDPLLEATADQAGGGYVGSERPHLNRREQAAGTVVDGGPIETTGEVEQEPHGNEQTKVTDAVGDEGLLAGSRVLVVFEPEADEQVAAQADAFPADEQHRQAVAEDQHQHREDEQV
jgi:hypothetical protein